MAKNVLQMRHSRVQRVEAKKKGKEKNETLNCKSISCPGYFDRVKFLASK